MPLLVFFHQQLPQASSRSSVVGSLPQDDCQLNINSVFATRQVLQKLLKSPLFNLLLFTQPDRQRQRSGKTKLTGGQATQTLSRWLQEKSFLSPGCDAGLYFA